MFGSRSADGRPVDGTGGKDLLWFIAEGTAGAVGERFFQRLVQRIAQAFAADVAFVAELVGDESERARFLACWEGDGLAQPREYELAGTPCADVGAAGVVSFPEGVLQRFPDDDMVARLRLDSYLAVALQGADGEHLGHLGVLAAGRCGPTRRSWQRCGSSLRGPPRSSSAAAQSARSAIARPPIGRSRRSRRPCG